MTSFDHTFEQDSQERWLRGTIRRHGWALQAVLGDDDSPPYVHTVGLAGFGHPELILFATSHAVAAAVLNDLGARVRDGQVLGPLDRVSVRLGDLRLGEVHLLTFPESELWLFAADDLYRAPGGPPVPALLVVPADDLEPVAGEQRPCRSTG